ncbi:hypothetical protein [Maritalea sp. S77]|jgi:ABC-type multidrug transport system permease subunit|uniref:hypothetical protein n=1 Tax=Maritalea sp. S77 TaxID=3415125 RepID=UPI003C7B9E79
MKTQNARPLRPSKNDMHFSLTKYFIALTLCTIGMPAIALLLGQFTGGYSSPIVGPVSLFLDHFGYVIGQVWMLSILGAAIFAIWRSVGASRK